MHRKNIWLHRYFYTSNISMCVHRNKWHVFYAIYVPNITCKVPECFLLHMANIVDLFTVCRDDEITEFQYDTVEPNELFCELSILKAMLLAGKIHRTVQKISLNKSNFHILRHSEQVWCMIHSYVVTVTTYLSLVGKFEEIQSAGLQIQNRYLKILDTYFPPKYRLSVCLYFMCKFDMKWVW